MRLPAVLCVLTVLLGGFAAFAAGQASGLRDEPSARNAALTDIARTSEVKGQITKAVEAVFSYNFTNPGALDQAAKAQLTGKAVTQHREMLAAVRTQGPKQKLVLTTTVTESGVELIDGDRARLLIFADQSNTRTATKDETTYAAAMFAVDAVRGDGAWRIAAIDTFGAGS
jgi:Mce-associated membrane protein